MLASSTYLCLNLIYSGRLLYSLFLFNYYFNGSAFSTCIFLLCLWRLSVIQLISYPRRVHHIKGSRNVFEYLQPSPVSLDIPFTVCNHIISTFQSCLFCFHSILLFLPISNWWFKCPPSINWKHPFLGGMILETYLELLSIDFVFPIFSHGLWNEVGLKKPYCKCSRIL